MTRAILSCGLGLVLLFLANTLPAATFDQLTLPKGVGTLTCVNTEGSSIFVGTTAGVAVYETKSQQWTVGNKPIIDKHITSIAASATSCMAVANDGTLWFSYNRGADWYQVQGMEYFSVATTVVCEKNVYVVGAANGVFTVNATQQRIVRLCSNELTGSVVNIAKLDDALVVVQSGQKGRRVVWYDGKSCLDVTESASKPIDPVQGGFFNGIPLLLDASRLYRWNDGTKAWDILLDIETGKPARFLNIHPTDPIAVIGHDTYIDLVDLNTGDIIDPSILADLARPSGSIGSGGFIEGRWTGASDLGPLLTSGAVATIIEQNRRRDVEFYMELTDDVPTLLANVPYRMYAVECNDRRLIKSGTVGADGRIRTSFGDLDVDSTTLVEFEVIVKTETTDKVDRLPGFDTLYVQTIRSRRLGTDGSFILPQLKDIRNQRVVLGHTMIGFRFMVGIEWDADQEYIDSLSSWMRLSSDFLLDITDGQAYIERIAISDAKQSWGAKDIAFETSNTVWPHVNQLGGLYYGRAFQWLGHAAYMPRAHYGNRDGNLNRSALPDWLALVKTDVVTTLVHELGHHVFGFVDEYASWLVWNNQPLLDMTGQGRCFGLMHYNYFRDRDSAQTRRMASELSADRTVWTTGGGDLYSATFQFTTHRKPCWEMYRDSYTRTETIGGTRVRARILRPADRTLAVGDSIVLGPRDILSNQATCLYQPPMQILDRTVASNARSGLVNVTNGGIGVIDIDVDLLENATTRNKLLYQGKTSNTGTLRVLGMRAGNIVKVFGRSGFDRITSTIARVNNGEIVVPAVSMAKGGEDPQKEEELAISTETADVTSRRLFFVGTTAASSSTIDIADATQTLETRTIKQDGDATEMVVSIPSTKGEQQLPIYGRTLQTDAAENILAHDGQAQFFKESNVKLSGTTLCIVKGFVPPPFNGIDEADELLSDLVAIGSDGTMDGIRSMQIRTWHAADKGRFAVVHKWDATSATWKPLPSFASTEGDLVSASFEGKGTYAVFSRPTAVTSVHESNPTEPRLAPNPASSVVTITLLEESLTVELLDLAGNTLMSAQQTGVLTWTADCSKLVNGLYFVRCVSNGRAIWMPLVVNR
ncbi:MAG: hypothetical protein JSS89_09930 [Bacteroidetes bacterium]|nr:hypothetical protein [Bacteroidota bacterium]